MRNLTILALVLIPFHVAAQQFSDEYRTSANHVCQQLALKYSPWADIIAVDRTLTGASGGYSTRGIVKLRHSETAVVYFAKTGGGRKVEEIATCEFGWAMIGGSATNLLETPVLIRFYNGARDIDATDLMLINMQIDEYMPE